MAEPIHSGHFMRSKVHQEKTDEDTDSDVEVDVCSPDMDNISETESETNVLTNPNNMAAQATLSRQNSKKDEDEKPVTFYKFGPKQSKSIAIDVSLGQLNRCISYAYKKLTTPKWKNFNGLKLKWKQRIRLNNVIWRGWYMEFKKRKLAAARTPYCFFSIPTEDKHDSMEGVAGLVEGMYWKRRVEAVCAQYKRWRHFYQKPKPGSKRNSRTRVNSEGGIVDDQDEHDAVLVPRPPSVQRSSEQPFFYVDDLENTFTDRLFESLTEPYMFPNPKEMAQAGNADFIQPSLMSFQPSLEDIMLSLDNPLSGGNPALASVIQAEERDQAFPTTPTRPIAVTKSANKYTSNDYAVANMLIEYSSKQTPPQPQNQSPLLSQSTLSPLYSQAAFDSRLYGPENQVEPPYLPQLATLSPMKTHESSWLSPPPYGEQAGSSNSEVIRYVSKAALKSYPPAIEESDQPPKKKARDSPRVLAPEKQLNKLDQPLPRKHRAPTKPIASHATVSVPAPPVTHPHTPVPTSVLHVPPLPGASPFLTTSLLSSQPLILMPQGLVSLPSVSRAVHTMASNYGSSAPMVSLPAFSSAMIKQEVPSTVSLAGEGPSTSRVTVKDNRLSTVRDVRATKQAAADSTLLPEERKKILHLHAEQSRRSALKDGFAQLMEILPNLHSGAVKPTNAVVLAKASEFIRTLKGQREVRAAEIEILSGDVNRLNEKIGALQTALPSTSHSISAGQSHNRLDQSVEKLVKERTKHDWRFWILNELMSPLLETFNNEVTGESPHDLAQSARQWASKNCQLLKMRPIASETLVKLATSSPVLTEPHKLKSYVEGQIKKP